MWTPSRRVASASECRRSDPGIDDGWPAVVEDGATAEDPVAIGTAGSGESAIGLVLPVNHVGAGGVRPIHVAPDGGLRIVLVEHVIASAEKDGTVGIVHPVVGGEQVILGAKRIGGELAAERGVAGSMGEEGDSMREQARQRRKVAEKLGERVAWFEFQGRKDACAVRPISYHKRCGQSVGYNAGKIKHRPFIVFRYPSRLVCFLVVTMLRRKRLFVGTSRSSFAKLQRDRRCSVDRKRSRTGDIGARAHRI